MTSRGPIVVVGAGIVGLATARALQGRSSGPVLVLEKEDRVAAHQTGHNSGVIHSGIYYRPGTLKARLCVEGHDRMVAFAEAHHIPYERCGKLIVATRESERPYLGELERRAASNGIPGVARKTPEEIRQLEPNVRALEALHVPTTGIIDYLAVSQALASEIQSRGGAVQTGTRVIGLQPDGAGVSIRTDEGPLEASLVLNCAGLYSDRVARLSGLEPAVRIIPFRGEYYLLRPERRSLVRGLVYPVPDPELPFLGVHYTRTVHGEVEAGPNAVPALAREGYNWRAVELRDLIETAVYPGTPGLLWRYGRVEAYEVRRSLIRGAFVRDLQRIVPSITEQDLTRGGSGVRAQAVSPDGKLVDDFVIAESPRAVHVLNAPSPAATASLAIGDYIASVAAARYPDLVGPVA